MLSNCPIQTLHSIQSSVCSGQCLHHIPTVWRPSLYVSVVQGGRIHDGLTGPPPQVVWSNDQTLRQVYPPPPGIPPFTLWGDESYSAGAIARWRCRNYYGARIIHHSNIVQLVPEVVEFYRQYNGPTISCSLHWMAEKQQHFGVNGTVVCGI